MSVGIEQEIHFLMSTVVLGVGMTFIYDWLRIVRRVIPHKQFYVSVGDFCYWCVSFYVSFQVLYRENNGMIRWFSVVGAAIGMVIYKLTISPYFVKYMVLALGGVLRAVGKVMGICLRPIYRMGIHVRRKARFSNNMLKKKREILRKKLTRHLKMIKLVIKNQ